MKTNTKWILITPESVIKSGVLACVAIIMAGCSSPSHPFIVKRGGFLQDEDYAAFQHEADKRKPIALPKNWPNPSPELSYSFDRDFDFRSVDRIAVPDLVIAPVSGARQDWTRESEKFQKLIADQIAALLVANQLVSEAPRSTNSSPVTMAGAITFFHHGSSWAGAAGMQGALSQDFMQTEFQILANGRKVGAIQVNAVRGRTMIGVMVAPTIERQIANGAVRAFKGMKTNVREDRTDHFLLPDWFIK